jgi:oxaloacetate decarboxylase alpha subunit
MAKLNITDVILRDAHQSLLATRLKTEDMLPISAKLDKVGYWSLETWGGATFDSCIRFLNEDPWERIAALKKAMPNTKMQMLLRGQNILGYRHYADDVVEAFVKEAAQYVDVFRIFDALNDTRNLKTAIKAVKANKRHAQGAISYTTSPVHTVKAFIELGKELQEMGCDSVCIKDMAGLLTPTAAFELVSGLKKNLDIPVNLHSHATTGLSTTSIFKAVEAGVDIVDSGISALALGSAHSPTETVVAMFRGTQWDTGFDLKLLDEIATYFKEIRKKYGQFEGSFIGVDTNILMSQVPGGMLTNLENQLRQMNAADKIDQVMEEIQLVRKDFGYPPLVTPTSQIVGTQAVFNVLNGRYKTVTKESKGLLRGEYGRCPAPVNEDVRKMALGDEQPIDHRPADDIPNELEKLKKEIGSKARDIKDVLTYALFPQVAEKFFETRGKKIEEAPVAVKAPAAAAAPAAGEVRDFSVVVDGKSYAVTVIPGKGGSHQIHQIVPAPAGVTQKDAGTPGSKQVKSPLPGAIVKVVVKDGDKVSEGDTLMVIEAMKMETPITAPFAGTVASINVAVGDQVNTDQLVATLE